MRTESPKRPWPIVAVPVVAVIPATLTLLVHTIVVVLRPPANVTIPPVENIPPVESVVAIVVPAATASVDATERFPVRAALPAIWITFAGLVVATWSVLT
jgi:hypothetical protein